jgi:hypothetical protein
MPSRMGTLLKACGRGNQVACTIAKKIRAIYAGSVVTFSDANKGMLSHPNKMPFRGTLLICDEPSDKPPHGAQGHRILVTSEVAKSKLGSLPGMAVNYDPSDMDEHATQNKVGVITKAWMDGKEVKIAGFVWKKDFPEAERDLKRKDLGTSMELADVYVKNEHANIWELNDFEFTGATILKRNAAAYTKTSLAAAAKAAVTGEEGDKEMSEKNKDKKRKVAAADSRRHGSGDLALMTQAISGSLGTALSQTLGPIVQELKASSQRQEERLNEFIETQTGLRMIEAAAEEDESASDNKVVIHARGHHEDESNDEAEMEASGSDESNDMEARGNPFGKGGGDDDDDSDESDESASDSSASDASELEAMEDLELDHPDQSTGEVNKDATNKGSKTSVEKPPKQGEHFSGNVAKGRLHSAAKKGNGMKKPFPGLEAAAEVIGTMKAANRKMKRDMKAMAQHYEKKNRKLLTKVQAMEESLEYFTERESRRSAMPTELVNLAAKSGVNLGEIKAQGQTLSVSAVDHMFAVARSQGINIDPEQRIAMKMTLEQEGLMENGEVQRNYGRLN